MDKIAIHITNKCHLNHTNKLIYRVLSDLDSYNTWWDGATFTKLNDTTLEVALKGPGSFTLTLTEQKEDHKIVFAYQGIFSGTGTWVLDYDSAMTYVSYSVNLSIEHGFYRFINKFFPIQKMHSAMMEKVFIKLDRYLSNLHIDQA